MTKTEPNKFKFKRASSIVIPDEFFNPLVTGLKEVDEAWSEIGGVVPSQVTFITGPPGSGKTTLTLAISACVSNQIPVAFISLEMSDFQLAHQAKKIPGFGNVDVTGEFNQVDTMAAIRELKPGLIVVDSIQKAARKMKTDDGKTMAFNTAQTVIVEMFTKYAKETWTPVFLIGHCDKSGNYKGPSDLLHDVDSHLLVAYDKEMDIRTFEFGKNRFGGVIQETIFGITSSNVWIGTPYISTVFSDAVIVPTNVKTPQVVAPISADGVKVCIQALGVKWDGGTARATISALVEFMKANDPEFEDNSLVGNPIKVKAAFRGNSLAHCHPSSGELVFGKKTFLPTMDVGTVGYVKEQPYIHARITTKQEMLVWIVIHEWCHLYKDMQNHKPEFFEFVAKKYDWLALQLI